MKGFSQYGVSKVTRTVIVGALFFGLAGCQGMPGSEVMSGVSGFGIPLPTPPISGVSAQCLSMDVAKELWVASNETGTVESALDRVNTAARIIEIGDLIIRTLPISGGSDWPGKVNGSVPFVEGAKLQQLLQKDPVYAAGAQSGTSALKLKLMYLQTVLFNVYPEIHATRKMGVAAPSEAAVNALATKVLGPGSSPAFTKVFYRFLQYSPAFEPKKELFTRRLNGSATEVYGSLLDAVVSLAENHQEIKQLQKSVVQAEEKKAKELRDILDLAQRIHKLEMAEFGTPSTPDQAVQASDKDTNAKEVEDLKGQLLVQEEEFKTTVKAYMEELEKLGLEMAKIKTQVMAFTPEQRALALNIQTAVDAAKGAMCQSQMLTAIAAYHLKEALPRWKDEVRVIAGQGGPVATERIKRVVVNLTTLPHNLAILMMELKELNQETKIADDLFGSRVAVNTSDGKIGGASLLSRLP